MKRNSALEKFLIIFLVYENLFTLYDNDEFYDYSYTDYLLYYD